MHRHRYQWALAAVLVIAGCGGDDDTGNPATTTSLAQTTAGETTEETTGGATAEATTSDVDPECLAAPAPAGGERSGAGTVEERRNDLVEVDCQEVFGGETLLERSVLASDGRGSAKYTVGNVADCSLLPRSTVRIRPEDDIVLRVDDGETTCSVTGSAENGYQAGESLTIMTTTARMTFSVDGDGPVTVTVIEGLVALASSDFECRSVVGPGQQAVVDRASNPTVTAIDLSTLPSDLIRSIDDVGGTIEPAPIPDGLLPGLSVLFDSGDMTIVVDGDVAGSAEVDDDDDVAVLEAITGRDIVLDRVDPGRIEVGQPIRPPEIVIADRLDQIRALPTTPVVAGDIEQALDDPIDELVLVPVLADGTGRVWTVAFDGSTPALEQTVTDELRRAIDSGAYGRFYEARFGLTPDYSVVRPELLGGADTCG